MKRIVLIAVLVAFCGCVKSDTDYSSDPDWNKPPSEKYQSPNASGSYDKYYDQANKSRAGEREDPYFDKFQKREAK